MNKFIGREIELKDLNNMYRSDKFWRSFMVADVWERHR